MKNDPKLADCKVIFLSAKNKLSDVEKGLNLGADAYMTKPFSMKKLTEKVNELLSI
ncbi:MAG: response regulator transcription factor [Flavobacterium sp.]